MISAKKLINPAKIMYAMPPDQNKLAGWYYGVPSETGNEAGKPSTTAARHTDAEPRITFAQSSGIQSRRSFRYGRNWDRRRGTSCGCA